MQQWSGRNRRRRTCWKSRMTVADGGTRVWASGPREGGPRRSTARRPAQSMCRRKEEVDEASPQRRRSQRSLHLRSVQGQIHDVKVVRPCSPNKKEARARRKPWSPRQVGSWRGGRGELHGVRRSSQTQQGKHVSESLHCHPGFGQGAASRWWQAAGQTSFFFLHLPAAYCNADLDSTSL